MDKKMRNFEEKLTLTLLSIDWTGVFGNDTKVVEELTKLLNKAKKNGYAEIVGEEFIEGKLQDIKFLCPLGTDRLWG